MLFRSVLAGVLTAPGSVELLAMIQRLQKSALGFRLTYVIGNHDRVLRNFPSLQADIKAKLPNVPVSFASRVRESQYGLMARHGHEWDENCVMGGSFTMKSSSGESRADSLTRPPIRSWRSAR